jgi:hypothetical protein
MSGDEQAFKCSHHAFLVLSVELLSCIIPSGKRKTYVVGESISNLHSGQHLMKQTSRRKIQNDRSRLGTILW